MSDNLLNLNLNLIILNQGLILEILSGILKQPGSKQIYKYGKSLQERANEELQRYETDDSGD